MIAAVAAAVVVWVGVILTQEGPSAGVFPSQAECVQATKELNERLVGAPFQYFISDDSCVRVELKLRDRKM